MASKQMVAVVVALVLALAAPGAVWAQGGGRGGGGGGSGGQGGAQRSTVLKVTPEMIKAGEQWLNDTDHVTHLILNFGDMPSETLAVAKKVGRMRNLQSLSIGLDRAWVERDLVFLDGLPPVKDLYLREGTGEVVLKERSQLNDDKLATFVSKLKAARLLLGPGISVSDNPKVLRVLSKKPGLKFVSLSLREATDEELAKVTGFAEVQQLELELLDGSPVTDKGLKWVGMIGGLEKLRLKNMPGVSCMFLAGRKTSLDEFTAINVGVTDEAIRSGWITGAELVHLDRTKVTSKGLGGVMPLGSLKTLRLWGAAADVSLCKGLSNCQRLEAVYLEGLTDQGLEMLVSGVRRFSVYARGSKISQRAMEVFRTKARSGPGGGEGVVLSVEGK